MGSGELSLYTRSCLEQAGWFPGRRIDASRFLKALSAEGYEPFPGLEEFLSEFGGLIVRHKHFKGLGEDEFFIDPVTAIGDIYIERVTSYSERIRKPLVLIGEAFSGHMALCLSDDLSLYAGYDETLILIGSGICDALNNLCEGAPSEDVPP